MTLLKPGGLLHAVWQLCLWPSCGEKVYRAAALQCMSGSAYSPGHVSVQLFLGMLQLKIGFLHAHDIVRTTSRLPRSPCLKEPKFV